MNLDDRIDQFFDWSEQMDEQLSLAERLPSDVDTSSRRWWSEVIGVSDVLVDCDGDTAHCAVLCHALSAHVRPQPAMLVTIDWWQLHGRTGARDLARTCTAAAQAVGRAL